jgi:hypothetical protein
MVISVALQIVTYWTAKHRDIVVTVVIDIGGHEAKNKEDFAIDGAFRNTLREWFYGHFRENDSIFQPQRGKKPTDQWIMSTMTMGI